MKEKTSPGEPAGPQRTSSNTDDPKQARHLFCPTCSKELYNRSCKWWCPNCGYHESCADG